MANGQLEIVLRHIHQLAAAHNGAELTDGQLLEQFAGGEQESAFTALVRRHGPMVLGVCRRVLHDRHLAEDAFQATFLVLFRKARSLDRRGSVASWLYTVAYHAALRARADSARRHRQERQVREMSPPRATADTAVPPELWHDLRPVLDEELSRLPEKYRSAVLLCYVEGKTNEEAARLLRVPAGTIKSRLSRARELLRSRLSRRGVTLSAGLVGAVLAEHATAAVPAGLVHITVQTALLSAAGLASAPAAALAEGVLHAMFATKLKIATVFVVAVGVAAIGIGTITHRALAQRQQDVAVAEAPKSKPLTPSPSPQRGEGRKKVQADEQEMTVTGRVVDAKGRPVPNAGVAAAAFSYHGKRGGDLSDNLNRVFDKGQADREGRFQLTFRRSTSLASYSEAYLFAAAK
ncbi:MAG TPA: sigma-70 family RNA polymerase sigma factor, partial [Gemmataceae bacterium]|nr:sigma-70 family RNA polymerase sigma factor [Gemmataceae bacterium]